MLVLNDVFQGENHTHDLSNFNMVEVYGITESVGMDAEDGAARLWFVWAV